MRERENNVGERLARCMDEMEQEAVLKWADEDQPLAASALAGARGKLPDRRRRDMTL